MANDFIPRGDAEFNGWQANFVSYANANLAALGLVAGAEWWKAMRAQSSPGWRAMVARDFQSLEGDQGCSSFPSSPPSGRREKQKVLGGLAPRDSKSLATDVRPPGEELVRRLQASPAVSDPEREALGITVRDTEPMGGTGFQPVNGPPTAHRLEANGVRYPSRECGCWYGFSV